MVNKTNCFCKCHNNIACGRFSCIQEICYSYIINEGFEKKDIDHMGHQCI